MTIMKTILKTTLFTVLLSTALTTSAQSLVNESKITSVEIFETNDDSYTVKTVINEKQPILFNPNDRGMVNQRIIDAPVSVERTIYIDNDNDSVYDKKVSLTYIKDSEDDLDYMVAQNGVVFINDEDNSYVAMDGEYEIETDDIGDVAISIEEVDFLD